MEYGTHSNSEIITNRLFHYHYTPWHISIVSKSRRGQRRSMEDRIWFEPPIHIGNTTYIQCCMVDGHSTFPLELESFFNACKKKLKRPFDDSAQHQKEWQDLIDTYESNWSSEGGLVCHLVSISFRSDSNQLTCVRYQIGDCNSMFVSQGAHMGLMYVHNTSQVEELHRVLPYLENGRVGGVLACTRVIGNKDLKETLSSNILDPICMVDTQCLSLDRANPKGIFICGTDGLMSDRSCIEWISRQTRPDTHCMSIADECMSRAGYEDNVSFIVVEFHYLKISV